MSEPVDVGELFDRHAPFLLRSVQRLTGAPGQAEDLVQEVFLLAHRKRAELASHPDPRGWLFLTARNLVLHHRRRFARAAALAERAAAEPVESPEEPESTASRAQQGALIRATISKLPMKQREVFVLFELEGVEGKEIAALLDIPEGTVWTRLLHARKRFRELWARRGGGFHEP